MNSNKIHIFLVLLIVAGSVMLSLGNAQGQEWTPQPEQVLDKKSEYSPYVDC